MNNYYFDFNEIKTINDFYQQCALQLNFPDWFGNNLDGLWDLLTTLLPAMSTFHFLSFGQASEAEEFDDLLDLLRELEQELDGQFQLLIN